MNRAGAARSKLLRAVDLLGLRSKLTFEMDDKGFDGYPVTFRDARDAARTRPPASRSLREAWLEDEWVDVPAGLKTLLDGVCRELGL
jgi:hypothetical protein